MRRLYRGLFFIFLFGITPVLFNFTNSQNAAAASPPTLMNFQGRLTNTAGNIVADGSYNMKFAVYSVSSGGSSLWSETRETTNRVVVTNGLFSVKLGEVTALPASIFQANATLYFEIQLANPATATCSTAGCATYETAMTPRSQLATSAYAFSSTSAETATTATTATTASNSTSLGGVTASSYARQDVANTFTGSNTFNSTLLQSVTNSSALSIQNATSTPYFSVDTSVGGKVQIGSSTSDATGIQFVLDASTADPTGINGGMYYSSSRNTTRCYVNSGWQDCAPLIARMTADQSSTSTTAANVTQLTFPMQASTDYVINCNLYYQTAATTTGIKLSATGPGTPTAVAGSVGTFTAATTGSSYYFNAYDGGTATAGVAAVSTNIPASIDLNIRNGTTAGSFFVRLSSEVSGSSVTLKTGSVCRMFSL